MPDPRAASGTPDALYFAYGSNLPRRRIEARLGPCELLGAAVLAGHALRFHKTGRDGSGKCDALWTGHPEDRVHGALFALDPGQRCSLHGFEGSGYVCRGVVVECAGEHYRAYTYCARAEAVGAGLRPFDWYLDYVVCGAREHRLPQAYVAALETVACQPDHDAARSADNRRVLSATGR